MHPLVGEFMGTLVLVLLGDGVVANVLLSKTKGNNSGWIVIATGWGFAVMAGVFVAGAFGSTDGYINPAVTLWSVMGSGDTSKLAMIPAQFAGGFVGAVLVWLHYLPHWKETQDQGAKLAVFCTGPAIRNTPANLMSEIIGTTVLLVGVGSIFAKISPELAVGIGPYLVGVLVWGIGLSLGGTTGYAINPARDLAPRIAHAILPISGKGSSDWGYAWIPVVGPCIAAALAWVLFKFVV
jgi:glycerol uptake facilitator protein